MQEGRLGVLHTVLQRLAASLCKNPPLPPLKRLHQFCPKMYVIFWQNHIGFLEQLTDSKLRSQIFCLENLALRKYCKVVQTVKKTSDETRKMENDE